MKHKTCFTPVLTRLTLVIFISVLIVPAVYGLWEDPAEREKWEKRKLATPPGMETLYKNPKVFFKQLDDYLNDHFGFALLLNKFCRKLRFYGFKVSPSPNVTIGDNNIIFLNSHDTQKSHRYSAFGFCQYLNADDDVLYKKLSRTTDKIFSSFSHRGMRAVIIFAPSKPAIYPDLLPPTVPLKFREACRTFSSSDNTLIKLSASAVKKGNLMMYPLKEFLEKRDEPYFYPRESFHWEGMSPHFLSKGVLKKLGMAVPRSFGEGKERLTNSVDTASFFGFDLVKETWAYPYTQFKVTTAFKSPEVVLDYYEQGWVWQNFSANPLSNKKALLLSDSFGPFIMPHLAPGYGELIAVNIANLQDKEYKSFFNEMISRLAPDDVFFVVHDGAVVSLGLEKIAEALE